jgi:hypothetical protein
LLVCIAVSVGLAGAQLELFLVNQSALLLVAVLGAGAVVVLSWGIDVAVLSRIVV